MHLIFKDVIHFKLHEHGDLRPIIIQWAGYLLSIWFFWQPFFLVAVLIKVDSNYFIGTLRRHLRITTLCIYMVQFSNYHRNTASFLSWIRIRKMNKWMSKQTDKQIPLSSWKPCKVGMIIATLLSEDDTERPNGLEDPKNQREAEPNSNPHCLSLRFFLLHHRWTWNLIMSFLLLEQTVTLCFR